ncbi:deleted in malignant brain tumors 1 protein-like isoform X2, partial [Silurus asotus]
VRLVGGSRCSGRVEVLHGKTWFSVCDADFDKPDFEVVCRELGCGPPVMMLGAGAVRRGNSQVWSEQLQCKGTESQIYFCPKSTLRHSCSHDSKVGLVCADSVRLVNGSSHCAGRVEVLHRGEWGTVCDDNWNMKAAAVVCGELGCGEAVDALHHSHFGEGSDSIWMDDVSCTGLESTLKNCGSAEFSVNDCDHMKDAGVICSEVRLVGGSRCSGRVEVLHGMTWFSVCDADFTKQDAEVVCREVDCGPPMEVRRTATIGVREAQELTKQFQCRGNESHINLCPTTLSDNCSQSNNVELACAESLKLVNGGSQCAGRVEVFYRGQWGTVCDDGWNMKAAAVVCKELGCGEAIDALSDAHFGLGTGPVWMVVGECSGDEETLKSCLSGEWGTEYCSHEDDAGVVCSGVRLVGVSHCSGRIEVLNGKTWATVCNDDFSQQDAEVVCREVNCGPPIKVQRGDAFGGGVGIVWKKKLQCRGTESHIHFCPTSPLEHNCSHSNDVGLQCAGMEVNDYGSCSFICFSCIAGVRLVDGGSRCAGRLEILHRGLWGTVCEVNRNMRVAEVVCRELGCGEAVDSLLDAHFGPGSGPIWTDIYCTGSESTLKNCGSLRSGGHNCHHGRDFAVICSGHRKPRLMDGPHVCAGRIEVLYGNTWAAVCDAEFNQKNAEVVCRELGCGLPVKVLGASAFGKGKGQVWTKELRCRGNETQIYFCQGLFTLEHNCSLEMKDAGLICSGYTDARLVNGEDSCSGRVELKYLSEWGTVCAVNWNLRAANVLCGQLNCGRAMAVLESDWFGAGNRQIWADMFYCQGNETHLSQCPISSWSRVACSHKQDAGVICNGSSLAFHEGHVQLSGESECHGEVKVYFMEDWRRVLLHSWGLSEASVVCRQLGCGSVLSYNSSMTKAEHSHMCAVGFSCSGSETHLRNCRRAHQAVNCSSKDLLSITCSGVINQAHSSIRLVGSGGDCAGRLEVFYNGSWGTVRHDLWDIEDAHVVCRQMQCGVALSNHVLSWFGPGSGPIWLNQVECRGDEVSLWNCRFQFSEEDENGHQEDVGVVCSGTVLLFLLFFSLSVAYHNLEWRHFQMVTLTANMFLYCILTEGCKGNLEVFYNGTWGNVCENAIDKETASLICRELNCGRTGKEYLSKSRLKSAPNWLDGLKCRKHDATIWHCQSSPWRNNKCGNVAHITCTGWSYVFSCETCVICVEHLPLRLRNGAKDCSGRLELYYNDTWGTICSDQWDIKDAQVVCRQLGCGQAVSADRSTGKGDKMIWMNRVNCRGNEIHLWDCLYSLKNHTDCFHKQDAGVTCEG